MRNGLLQDIVKHYLSLLQKLLIQIDSWLRKVMRASVVLTICAISCADMQLKAEKDAKLELVLETWVCLKLLFFLQYCEILC